MKKVALVTGGTRGIGLAIGRGLLSEGYHVALVGTRERKSSIDALQDYGDKVLFIYGDIGKAEDRERIVHQVMTNYGAIDVLVNNAGVAPKKRMDLLDITEGSMDYVMDINLKGTFFLTQLVARSMLQQGKDMKGRIINISSISAYTSSVNRGEYCLSKAGISMLTKLYADRLAMEGIRVYEIRPGIIRTDMTEGVSHKYDELIEQGLTPIQRWGYPEDIANAVTLLCSPKMSFSTGEVINVDGGFHIRRL